MLQLQLIGNVGSDAVVKEANGNKFVSFSVGTNEKFKDANGDKVEKTTWISCILAKESPVKDYILKGTKVFIEGDLSVKSYKANDGTYQVGVNCRVRRIELLSSKKEDMPEDAKVEQVDNNDVPF